MLSSFSNPITSEQQAKIRERAEAAHPVEACGFVLNNGDIVECTNVSSGKNSFKISAEETALYLDDAAASWHSHIDFGSVSFADINASKALALPYAVFNCAGTEHFYFDPSQSVGLLERPWLYGGYDCYSAVRDWYSQEMGVDMGDYERLYEGEWAQRGFTHFEDNFAAEGFVRIPPSVPLERGDVFLMKIKNDDACNHVAVLEDPEANQIYQHLVGRKSEVMSYSGYFRDNTAMVVRRIA
jgi:proteasome lid subunit RPN8/RPN11|tara:strand:- start:372 stop:1094 length:723 start_codon:yes stop_codon:yes gene_type:complete